MYDVVVRKTTESERHVNPNPKPYLVAVQYVLPRRKESSRSLSHLLISFLLLYRYQMILPVLTFHIYEYFSYR